MSGLAGISIGARLLGVRRALAKVPAFVWLLLAVLLASWLAWNWHKAEVRGAFADGKAAGASEAYARVEAKARTLERQTNDLTIKIRNRFNDQSTAIAAHADALRLRGPGRAACSVTASTSAGRHVEAAPATSPAVGRVSYPERIELIGLPFPGAVALAENHDLCVAEAQAWRDQNAALWEAWRKAGGKQP